MDFGIAFPSYVDAWRDCEVAEAVGFTHAWFYDTQLLCSDVYAVMALAAEHTRTMTLGTLVAIPSNRIAPVTASAIATINALAPGRTILGIGTGFTGRNTMGMPPLPVAAMVDYVQQVRGLLAGEDVLYREGKFERWIRLLSRDRRIGCINLDDPIPIQYGKWLGRAVTGDFGQSFLYKRPVMQMIQASLPNTVQLALISLVVSISVGVSLGILAARFRGSPLDQAIRMFSVAGHAIPAFWFGLLFILVMAVQFRLFPVSGMQNVDADAWDVGDRIRHLAGPVLAHRLILSAELRVRGRSDESLVEEALRQVAVPVEPAEQA